MTKKELRESIEDDIKKINNRIHINNPTMDTGNLARILMAKIKLIELYLRLTPADFLTKDEMEL